jgi:serine/threonine protein kinase/tetratricopeptide (TPR) repeat protein
MIGQTISNYRILGKLGKGGMGVVYAAEDLRLRRKVAIKIFNIESKDPSYRQRFSREAHAISSFNHPNIAVVHDCGETPDGKPFIVLELIEGETLNELLGKGALTLARVLEIVEDVAKALAEAHRRNIIHRDIKPSNVMVGASGIVKVLDFGLAKSMDEPQLSMSPTSDARALLATQTREGMFIGTPHYVSPEQALTMPVDARSDLFSLGSLLYECLSGRHAFPGKSDVAICAKVIRDDPPPPSQFCAQVTPELDRITLKLLAKEPEARYQSAQELLADLREARATLNSSDRAQMKPIKPVTRDSRVSLMMAVSAGIRKPRVLLAVFLTAFTLAVATVWMLSASSPARIGTSTNVASGWYERVRRQLFGASSQPVAPEAMRWYKRGMEALHNGSYFTASKMMAEAVKSDDNFPLAHARLAEALLELDYTDIAKDEVIRTGQLVPDRALLPAQEALTVDAIINTVAGNFKGAVESNRQLAERAAGQEKAAALVDLGRAYEKADDLKFASQSYEEATRADPQYAAAFLRLGIAKGRQRDLSAAGAAFDNAQRLFETLGDIEGVTQVLYERGSMLAKGRQVQESLSQLEQAADKSRVTGNRSQQVLALLRLSTVKLFQGDMPGAQQLASDSVALAQSGDMENLVTRGLTDLGSALFADGKYGEAERYYKQSLDISRRNKGRRNEARTLLALGSLYSSSGRPREAVEYAVKSLEFLRQGGYPREVSLALKVLGHAYDQTGDYEAAHTKYGELLEEANRLGDRSQAAAAHEGFGLVLVHQERYPEAPSHFQQKYEINKTLGNRLYAARGMMQLALALWPVGRSPEAQDLLDRAAAEAGQPDEKDLKELNAWVSLVNSRMALSELRVRDAIKHSRQAIDLADDYNVEVLTEAKYTLGLALTMSGSEHAGMKLCEEAVALAEGMGDPHYIAGALLSLSEASFLNGKTGDALASALRAQGVSAKLGMQESEWRACVLAAQASRQLGGGAGGYATRASILLSELEQRWGAEAFNGYLSRPDIQRYRRSLAGAR